MIFLDAIVVKVRDGGHVRNKAAHLAISIDMDGIARAGHLGAGEPGHDVLGGRLRRTRQPRRAGDVLIICCDGLTGFPEAVGDRPGRKRPRKPAWST